MSPGIVGEGAGYELPKFKKAPWYPESYYPFRGYNFTTRKTIEEHPKLVKAFIMATEQAVRELKKMTNEDISQIVRKYWKLPPKQGTIVVADSLPLLRGWSWMTESDARSIVAVSKFMAETGALPKPLTMKEVKENVVGTCTDKNAIDRRGLPLWMASKWSQE